MPEQLKMDTLLQPAVKPVVVSPDHKEGLQKTERYQQQKALKSAAARIKRHELSCAAFRESQKISEILFKRIYCWDFRQRYQIFRL